MVNCDNVPFYDSEIRNISPEIFSIDIQPHPLPEVCLKSPSFTFHNFSSYPLMHEALRFLGRKSKKRVPLILLLTFPKETSQVIEVQATSIFGRICCDQRKITPWRDIKTVDQLLEPIDKVMNNPHQMLLQRKEL